MTKKEIYQVEGMTCSGCERTVQRVLSMLQGVSDIQASFKDSEVSLTYDPELVSIDAIKSQIQKLGYKFVGQKPTNGQRASSDDRTS